MIIDCKSVTSFGGNFTVCVAKTQQSAFQTHTPSELFLKTVFKSKSG